MLVICGLELAYGCMEKDSSVAVFEEKYLFDEYLRYSSATRKD
jgi:hypothetical protein